VTFGSRATAVAGVGYSTIHRELGVDSRQLAVTAAKQAIEDAGLTTSDIDGIFEYPAQGTQIAVEMQRMLGIRDLAVFGDNSHSGPSGLSAAQNAIMAVASGACETALVYRSVTREWGQQSGKAEFPPASGPLQYQAPYGDFGGIIPSMGMRKYRRFVDLGGSEEDYGHVAVNARRWSALNDRAVLRDPITMDDYLSSRYVAEPLRLLDCDYPVTGACATVITTAERAKDLSKKPVVVDAMAQGTGSRPSWSFSDDLVFGGTIGCGTRLWGARR